MNNNYMLKRLDSISIDSDLQKNLYDIYMADSVRFSKRIALNVIYEIASSLELYDSYQKYIDILNNAWHMMYGMIIRLDDIQDNQPIYPPFPSGIDLSTQYNILFSQYLVAESILDDLIKNNLSVYRYIKIRRFWSDMMIRMSSGQYCDIRSKNQPILQDIAINYQKIAQSKTGATYSLAFGSIGLILFEDKKIYENLAVIGEIYGTLIQYGDDINDYESDTDKSVSFVDVVKNSEINAIHMYNYIYSIYYKHVELNMINFPEELKNSIRSLFAKTFKIEV
jgi:hypothetical protein